MSSNKISFDDRVKPKNVLALNEKVAAIRRYEADPVYKSVGRYFNCSPDQIKRIIRQKNEILAEWNNRTRKSVVPTSHELKSVKMSFLGKAVHEWIRRMMYYTDFNLTNALIQTMAIEFKKVLGLQNFFPDKIWISNFRSTYNLKEVNTKSLNIGYQESHSVQLRDILRHLQDVCGSSGATEITPKCETISPCDDTERRINVEIVKDEHSYTKNVISRIVACQPSSSNVELNPEPSPSVPVTLVKTEPEQVLIADTVSQAIEPSSDAILTNEDAISCVKLLEEFALLKENFRLIGLIERLEEALKEKE